MSDYGTTWQDIEPTPQLEKNPTSNALDRFTTPAKAWHGIGYMDTPKVKPTDLPIVDLANLLRDYQS